MNNTVTREFDRQKEIECLRQQVQALNTENDALLQRVAELEMQLTPHTNAMFDAETKRLRQRVVELEEESGNLRKQLQAMDAEKRVSELEEKFNRIYICPDKYWNGTSYYFGYREVDKEHRDAQLAYIQK